MRYLQSNKLHCFSPPVMIATFVIEISLAVYVIWRYKLNDITRLAAMILTTLAVFQLAEYNVCQGSFGIDSLGWSRLGYIAITLLPPLGLHLATKIAGHAQRGLVLSAYASATLFALFFGFSGQGINASACMGNYVIFETAPGSTLFYSIYYYGWLLLGVYFALSQASQVTSQYRARALRALAIGYLTFMVPTTIANVLLPETIAAIPSIMCGFAVVLAVVLSGEVLPQYFRQPAISEWFKRRNREIHR